MFRNYFRNKIQDNIALRKKIDTAQLKIMKVNAQIKREESKLPNLANELKLIQSEQVANRHAVATSLSVNSGQMLPESLVNLIQEYNNDQAPINMQLQNIQKSKTVIEQLKEEVKIETSNINSYNQRLHFN